MNKKKLLLIGVFIVGFIIMRYAGFGENLTFDTIKMQKDQLVLAAESHFLFVSLAFIGFYFLAVAFSFPLATLLTLMAGMLFGTFLGAVYVNIAATAGSILAFLIARYIAGDSLQKKYAEKLETFNRELSESGAYYLLMLRLIPAFPFFLINILAGLTRIPVTTFAWTTAVGIFPASLVYTFAGSQINTIDSPADILSLEIALALSLLGLLSVFPVVYKKIKKRRQRANS